MAMVGALQHAAQLAADAPVQAPAKDLGDAVGAQAQQAQITGALEQPVDGEVAPEDQVAAVLDLLEGVVTAEIDRVAVLFGKLGTDDEAPVLEPGANQPGAQRIGGHLQRLGICAQGRSIVRGPHRSPPTPCSVCPSASPRNSPTLCNSRSHSSP